MDKPIVNIALPNFDRFNSALIHDECGIINDLHFVNSVTKQESTLLGSFLQDNSINDYEFSEGSDIPSDTFDSFMPRDIDGIDELSDYMYYQSKIK